MSDEVKLNDQQLSGAAGGSDRGGAPGVMGETWMSGNHRMYHVVSGDNLGAIAWYFGITPQQIMDLNPGKITSLNYIQPGLTIYLS